MQTFCLITIRVGKIRASVAALVHKMKQWIFLSLSLFITLPFSFRAVRSMRINTHRVHSHIHFPPVVRQSGSMKPCQRFDCCSESLCYDRDSVTTVKILNGYAMSIDTTKYAAGIRRHSSVGHVNVVVDWKCHRISTRKRRKQSSGCWNDVVVTS